MARSLVFLVVVGIAAVVVDNGGVRVELDHLVEVGDGAIILALVFVRIAASIQGQSDGSSRGPCGRNGRGARECSGIAIRSSSASSIRQYEEWRMRWRRLSRRRRLNSGIRVA